MKDLSFVLGYSATRDSHGQTSFRYVIEECFIQRDWKGFMVFNENRKGLTFKKEFVLHFDNR